MPYLKDCKSRTVYGSDWSPFAFEDGRSITLLDKFGNPQSKAIPNKDISYNAARVSDREYRLAVARAKALKQPQT